MPFLLVCGQSVTTGAVGEVGEVGGFLIVTVFSPYYSSLLTCNQNQISTKQTMAGSPDFTDSTDSVPVARLLRIHRVGDDLGSHELQTRVT